LDTSDILRKIGKKPKEDEINLLVTLLIEGQVIHRVGDINEFLTLRHGDRLPTMVEHLDEDESRLRFIATIERVAPDYLQAYRRLGDAR
jgi:hypothetical protein